MGQTDFDYGWNAVHESEPHSPGEVFDSLPSSQDCDRAIICDGCGKFHGRCSEVTAIKEQLKMALPTGGNSGSSSRPQSRGGVPKLETSDLSRQPKEAKITGVKAVDGRFGPQVMLKLAIGGESRLWYLNADSDKNGKLKNPNYAALIKKFGTEENDWMNQTILLGLEVDDMTEQSFVRVTFPGKSR